MGVGTTVDVHVVRIRESFRIAVRGSDEGPDWCPNGNVDAVELEVDSGGAEADLHWCVVPKRLFDGAWSEGRFVAEEFPLVSVREQCEEAVADQVRRRLVSGVENEHM